MPRTRNRSSAKKAGTSFETLIVNYLARWVDGRIERRARTGAKDRGDVSGVRSYLGRRVVIEAKNTTRTALGEWAREVELERGNDDAHVGLIVHKRHGHGAAGEQWVTCTVADLVALLTGHRPVEETPLQFQAAFIEVRQARYEVAADVLAERTADAADRGDEQ